MITVQTPTPNLKESIRFYENLSFKRLSTSDNMPIYTDGKAIIEINEDRFARCGLKVYGQESTEVLESLNDYSAIEFPEYHLVSSPANIWLYIIKSPISAPIVSEEESFSVLGNNFGLSVEVVDMKASLKFWKQIGFEITMGGEEQGWVGLQDKAGFSISLMKPNACPHLFFNPSFTFFNGKKNVEIIDNLRSLDISFAEEITHFNNEGIVDNVIVRDPGGLGFFVFNDEV